MDKNSVSRGASETPKMAKNSVSWGANEALKMAKNGVSQVANEALIDLDQKWQKLVCHGVLTML